MLVERVQDIHKSQGGHVPAMTQMHMGGHPGKVSTICTEEVCAISGMYEPPRNAYPSSRRGISEVTKIESLRPKQQRPETVEQKCDTLSAMQKGSVGGPAVA